MATIEKRTFDLPADEASFIDERVASGAYATSSDVVSEGLRALQEREAAVERWLHAEVALTYDRWQSRQEDGATAEEMAERARKRHQARLGNA